MNVDNYAQTKKHRCAMLIKVNNKLIRRGLKLGVLKVFSFKQVYTCKAPQNPIKHKNRRASDENKNHKVLFFLIKLFDMSENEQDKEISKIIFNLRSELNIKKPERGRLIRFKLS